MECVRKYVWYRQLISISKHVLLIFMMKNIFRIRQIFWKFKLIVAWNYNFGGYKLSVWKVIIHVCATHIFFSFVLKGECTFGDFPIIQNFLSSSTLILFFRVFSSFQRVCKRVHGCRYWLVNEKKLVMKLELCKWGEDDSAYPI